MTKTMKPFWPDKSPAFLKLRLAVRAIPGDPAIGLSGGADSLALVAAAVAERRDVLAICVDHGLQPGSAEVATQAAKQAETLGATSTVIAVTVAKGNIEAQARKARYQALFEHAGNRPLWVAHTMDDQAETFLLSSLRGKASGMAAVGRITRPFLGIRRADTVAACQELGLKVWDDPMNTDPQFERVRLRHEVLPLLKEIKGSEVIPALAAAAALVRDDALALDSQHVAETDCARLKLLPIALRRRSYVALLRQVGANVGQRQLMAIDQLVMDWHGQGPVAVGGYMVVRSHGHLKLR